MSFVISGRGLSIINAFRGKHMALAMTPRVDRASSVRIFRPAHPLPSSSYLLRALKNTDYKRNPPVPHLNRIDRIE